jgi:hypothetical protein
VGDFEAIVNSSLQNGKSGVVLELENTSGIADIVIYKLRSNWESHACLGEINKRWAFALRSLPYRRSFDILYFASLLGVTVSTATYILKAFENTGYVVRADNKRAWRKHRQPIPLVSNFTAIEAKLSNWRRALFQASRYKSFATESWVLLDRKHSNSAFRNLDEFKVRNIGLAFLSTIGKIDIAHIPKKEKYSCDIRFWEANSELARRLSINSVESLEN